MSDTIPSFKTETGFDQGDAIAKVCADIRKHCNSWPEDKRHVLADVLLNMAKEVHCKVEECDPNAALRDRQKLWGLDNSRPRVHSSSDPVNFDREQYLKRYANNDF